MKISKLLSLSALLFTIVAMPARAEDTAAALPLLSRTHQGGFIARPLQNQVCTVYSSYVVVMRNGQTIARHPLRFSPQVPDLSRLYVLLRLAHLGHLVPTRGTVPDVGTSEYRALYPVNVLLQRNAFPRGARSTALSTARLISFTDSNCQ